MRQLEGRIALVTGSSRGIGAAIAKRFAAAGATVVVHGRGATAAQFTRAASADEFRTERSAPRGKIVSVFCMVFPFAIEDL